MFTTFDRYLLTRFLYAVAALFVAAIGLFSVVDGFMNLDAFQHSAEDSTALSLLGAMAWHYLLQTSVMIDLLGPTATVLGVLTTMALVMRHGELHPLLAAGVPAYRMAVPFVVGVILVNVVMVVNQEMIMPRIADELQGGYGEGDDAEKDVDAQYDPQSWIFVAAESLRLRDRTLIKPEFLLPTPSIVDSVQQITGESSRFFPARGRRPSGWLVKNPQPPIERLRLTEQGRRTIRPQRSGSVFIVSNLTADQLYNRGGSYRYLSTPELLQRIQLPGSVTSTCACIMHLHSRLTRPIITLIGVFLVLPLIARREKMSLVQNVATCMATLGLVYGLSLGGSMLGQSALMKPEIAAWAPLVFGGGLCAWLTGCVRT